MFLRLLAHSLVLALLIVVGNAAADGGVVFGTVELVEGSVTVTLPDGSSKSPAEGDWILSGSTIVTGADGELQVATEDSGFIAMRPDTHLRVDDYRADGGEQDHMALSLLKGTFRAISGWIGRFNRDNYQITTPTATLGIRGTDHEPGYVTEEDAARLGEEAGTYDKVNDGATYIQTAAGRTELAPRQSGFASFRPGAAPRLLPRLPSFYHPSHNENRIVQRRQQLRQNMLQQHAERHAWVQQHPGQRPTPLRPRLRNGRPAVEQPRGSRMPPPMRGPGMQPPKRGPGMQQPPRRPGMRPPRGQGLQPPMRGPGTQPPMQAPPRRGMVVPRPVPRQAPPPVRRKEPVR